MLNMTFDLYFVGVMSSLQCNICRAYIYTLLVSCRHYNVIFVGRIFIRCWCHVATTTLLLKSCIDQLIFPITTIINLSMQSGVVPQDFKQALVNPLIKKQTLCKDDLRNYRPISNLSFLSKILEKVVANRLHEHIYNHRLSNDLQSAYKRFHST